MDSRSAPVPYRVVVPVYNAARTLERMLAASRELRPQPAAIYLVDDVSTDRSLEIASAHVGVTSIALEVNRGSSRARNASASAGAGAAITALRAMIASGRYIDPAGFAPGYGATAQNPELAGIMGVAVRGSPPVPFPGFQELLVSLEKFVRRSCEGMATSVTWSA